MDLRQFEYFVQVAELADALSVSQPFVSKRIRQIESEMDAQFFRRNGRGIELTDLDVTPLIRRTVCLVSSLASTRIAPEQKVRFAQLAEPPLILPGHPHPMRRLIDATAASKGVTLTSAHDIIG